LNSIQSVIKSVSILILLFFGIVIASNAQSPYKSRLGRFQVDEKKGCAPFTVTITNANLITTGECTAGKPCLMDYQGNNTQQQNQFTFTYTTPGTYKLSVLYQSIGADDITITVDQNIQPGFEIYSCAANKVSVKVTDNNYDQYLIDFDNNGTTESIQPFSNSITAQHSYAPAGTYNINVRGRDLNSADNCTAKIQSFTTLNVLPTPSISTLTAVDATSLKLDYTLQSHIQQRLEIAVNNSSTFQLFQTLYETSTTTVPNLRVDDNYYAFRLSAYDPCLNVNNYSGIISSHNFDLTLQSGVNKLDWTTATSGVTSVTIQRGGTNYTSIPGAPLTFSDADVICLTNYCYKVINNYAGGRKSISLEKCGVAFTTAIPPIIDNISSVVGDPNGVELSWVVDPKINKPEFTIFRSRLGSGLQTWTTTTTPKVTDPDYATDGEFCYSVDYHDACGNFSPPGLPACPMRLAGTLDNKNVTTLTWPKYNGWANGVSNYTVEKYNKDGALITSVNVGTDTSYVDDPPDPKNQLIRYKIKATASTTGLTASVSNLLEIIKRTNLYAPTAFTPDNDKLNDTFSIGGQYIVKLSLKIFDRWGVLVYSSDKNQPWGGSRIGEGQPMPTGSYVWRADVTDLAGQNFSEEGTVILIRKNN
jgi:gliding motility-associated-like protein